MDASFTVLLLEVLTNKFKRNYWGLLPLKPHISIGILKIIIYLNPFTYEESSLSLPWFYIDWFPAQEPYDITGMR